MTTFTQPCEYAMCHCMIIGAIGGAVYCSDICERRDGADESADEACACGHPPCDAE